MNTSSSSADFQESALPIDDVEPITAVPQVTQESVKRVLNLTNKTHICHFYANRQELVEVLIPFFKEGLEKGEFCFWGADHPLAPEDAKAALRRAVPDLDYYLNTKQLVIFPVIELYKVRFQAQQTYDNFMKTVKEAMNRGFTGFRCDGNVASVPSKDWLNFLLYESYVDTGGRDFKITAMCSYPLSRCNETDIHDVRKTHQSALVKQGLTWEVMPALAQRKSA